MCSALNLTGLGPNELADLERLARRRAGDAELLPYCERLLQESLEREVLLSELADARSRRAAEDRTMEIMEKAALPLLVLDHALSGDRRIRIWTPEPSPMLPYRTAVSLMEMLGSTCGRFFIEIVVTGMAGPPGNEVSFEPWEMRGAEDRLLKHFQKEGDRFAPVPRLREVLEFVPTTRLGPNEVDMVVVPHLQRGPRMRRALARYCRSLRPGGLLVLHGQVPPLNGPDALLETVPGTDFVYRNPKYQKY